MAKMTWKDKYDRCMMDNQGDLIIIGEHCSLKQARAIINEDGYDEPSQWTKPKKIFVKFGFVNMDGEVMNGFLEFDDYKKGRIKATKLIEKKC